MSRHGQLVRVEAHDGHRSVSGGAARAAVFGLSDGLVSNVSLVIGFAGSGAGAAFVRLAGFAGAIAGAASMAVGEWVSISAQNELIAREVAVERREIAHNTRAEQAELAAIYERQGMSSETSRTAAAEVMTQPEAALAVHTREEFGVDPDQLASPWVAAGLSLVCFLIGALLPVIPWTFASGTAATWASILIGIVAAAAIGGAIGRFAESGVVRPAIRQVLLLIGACAVTWLIGRALGVSIN